VILCEGRLCFQHVASSAAVERLFLEFSSMTVSHILSYFRNKAFQQTARHLHLVRSHTLYRSHTKPVKTGLSNRTVSVHNLLSTLSCTLSLTASRNWQRTHWAVVLVDSSDAVQTITFVAFTSGQASASASVYLRLRRNYSTSRPRLRLLTPHQNRHITVSLYSVKVLFDSFLCHFNGDNP